MIPIIYIAISLLLSIIPSKENIRKSEVKNQTLYISTNGVHLDIIIKKSDMESILIDGLIHQPNDEYFSFGWGEKNFYLNTPTWGDLTFKTAVTALLFKSGTLVHVTRYNDIYSDWIEIKVTAAQMNDLQQYMANSFQVKEGSKVILAGKGYSRIDDFYEANGSYSCFKTCNTWANTAFKKSNMKTSIWTPFDFGILRWYK